MLRDVIFYNLTRGQIDILEDILCYVYIFTFVHFEFKRIKLFTFSWGICRSVLVFLSLSRKWAIPEKILNLQKEYLNYAKDI